MEWIELIVKAIGLIAAIFSSYKVTVKYIEKMCILGVLHRGSVFDEMLEE